MGAGTYIYRDFSDNGTSKITCSFWVKRAELGRIQTILCPTLQSETRFGILQFDVNDRLRFTDEVASVQMQYVTNRVFRDTSNWYHRIRSKSYLLVEASWGYYRLQR